MRDGEWPPVVPTIQIRVFGERNEIDLVAFADTLPIESPSLPLRRTAERIKDDLEATLKQEGVAAEYNKVTKFQNFINKTLE